MSQGWSHLLTHLTNWPTEQSRCDRIWPTCWSFLYKSNVIWHEKLLIWNNAIDFILVNTEPVTCTDLKSLDTTCFKTTWDNKLISHQWYFSAFIRPKVHALTYQMPELFSKEHVISRSHPDNLVCGWDPLDPPEKWPNWPRLSGSSDPLSTLVQIYLKWQRCIPHRGHGLLDNI